MTLPDLTEAIAKFEFQAGSAEQRQSGEGLDFHLRVDAAGEFEEGDFLCRAYLLSEADELVDSGVSSWSRSPHFESLYAYLPALAGSAVVPLPPFDTDAAFDRLLLAVQPWRDPAAQAPVSVEACLLRWVDSVDGMSLHSYHPVPRLSPDV